MSWRGRATALKLKSVDDFRDYLKGLSFRDWRPAGMTLHNTAEPSRRRWDDHPGEVWLRNLKSFYQGKGWSAGPHAFVDGDNIWVMTDFNHPGVHSPSWNGTRLGIEMVANFSVEDDESGIGLKVKQQTAALFAVCHQRFGWEPSNTSIKLHKEDPATDHDCPGRHIEKAQFIRMVTEYMASGGDHNPGPAPTPAPPRMATVNVPEGDTLNVRESSSASSRIVATLTDGARSKVIGRTMNGLTEWLRVQVDSTVGWAAAQFIAIDGQEELRHKDITATVFGGEGDEQPSAYGGMIQPGKLGVALPARFEGVRPKVRVWRNGKSVVCNVVDVGPWNKNDPYWLTGKRPQAESGKDTRGRKSNKAGIDLTPAAAKAIGLEGKGTVDWEFAQ